MAQSSLTAGASVPDIPQRARHTLAQMLRDPENALDVRQDLRASLWVQDDGTLNAGAACLFGADVGGTKIHSILCDLNGQVLAETRDPTPQDGGDALVAQIARHMTMLADGRPVCAAGIGLPGAIHPRTGHIDRAPNLPDFQGHDLRALIGGRLGIPVAVQNDVSLAALGEAWLGHGQGDYDLTLTGLAFIALGTGIGMGLAYGDRLIHGRNGAAGEIAWLPVGGNPASQVARDVGTLESVVAGQALVTQYHARGGTHVGSLRDLRQAARDDPLMAATLDDLAQNVALAVLSVDAIIDPGMVVFGGGIGADPELLSAVRAKLRGLGMPVPDLRVSLLGNRAGAIGAVRAARLAFADVLSD